MQDRPIGVFDSGLGGLTAVKEIKEIMPNEDVIYLGDTLHMPYGNKDKNTLIKYAEENIEFLLSKNVKVIIIACGTISSIFDFSTFKSTPLEGVIYPSCISAINNAKNNRIGVIGTTATINTGLYEKSLLSLSKDVNVFQQACPMLATLIEQGLTVPSDKLLFSYTNKYLSYFKNLDIDTLILGCTHYSIIKNIIKMIIGDQVRLIDSGKEAAQFLFKKLLNKNLLSSRNIIGKHDFFISKYIDEFPETASLFLGENIKDNLQIVNINKY